VFRISSIYCALLFIGIWYLLIYLTRYLDQETTKEPFRVELSPVTTTQKVEAYNCFAFRVKLPPVTPNLTTQKVEA